MHSKILVNFLVKILMRVLGILTINFLYVPNNQQTEKFGKYKKYAMCLFVVMVLMYCN